MEKWNRDEVLSDAAEYFKQPGFKRLFRGLRERYHSLSRLGGRVYLKNLTKEEAEALEGFLQVNVLEGSRITLSVQQVRKALEHTRYGRCSLEELVPLVLEESLVSNKQEQDKKEQELQNFFDAIRKSCEGTPAGAWLEAGPEKGQALAPLIIRDYHSDRKWITENIPLILHALNRLPAFSEEYLGLPVFAAAVTGNPHYFDEGKRSLKYLLYGICCLLGKDNSDVGTMEGRAEILYRGGILKDDLSNWVLCYGIYGYTSDKELHSGMEEYRKRGESQILTLKNLSSLKSATSRNRKVYVVENPSVFSMMMEHSPDTCACICSGGQLRLAVLVLMDLLVKSGVTLFYAGDFDPEGLSIAQKLVSRYGNRLKLWGYHEELYHRAISSEPVSERRLKQLDSLTDESLSAIGNLIRGHGRSGYQENIMDYFSEPKP